MSFKEDIASDLQTFVAASEFAQLCDINGVTLPAQVVRCSKEKSARLSMTYGMLHGDFSELYFMKSPYVAKKGKLPVEQKWLWINGIRYDVMKVEEDLGMVYMLIAAYRQEKITLKSLGGN